MHRAGLLPDEGNHTKDGLYHSSFVKVLTNLTDLNGPEDGGTGPAATVQYSRHRPTRPSMSLPAPPCPPCTTAVVVAGSHKINHDDEAIVSAAYDDRSMIHQVTAAVTDAGVSARVAAVQGRLHCQPIGADRTRLANQQSRPPID